MSGRPTVLVVDDEREACDLMLMALDARGFRTLVAHDGLAAWELLQQHHPAVLIVDIKLPGLNGYELVMRLRKDPALGSTPVIVVTGLTGSSQSSDEEWARACGAEALFTKPFAIDAFVAKVSALASRRGAAPRAG